MGRIRTVKPDFFIHSDLYDAEEETGLPLRLAYIGLWTVCDREGRFKWKPKDLKMQVLPFDDVDFSRVLDALVTRGYIVKYASQYAWIPSFKDHQNINNRETPSVLPAPGEDIDASVTRGSRVDHATFTRLSGVTDASSGEGKGREGKVNIHPPPPPEGGMREVSKIEMEVREFFGIGEINHARLCIHLGNAITCLTGNNRIEHFENQFHAYREFKKLNTTRTMWPGIESFLGTGKELFEDGKWNSTWQTLLEDFRRSNPGAKKTTVSQPKNRITQ